MPHERAGLGVVRVDVAAQRLIAGAGVAGDHFALHVKRRRRNPALAVGIFLHVNVPDFRAGFRVESHYVIVLRAHVNPAVAVGDAAGASDAERFHFRPFVFIGPDRPARGRLDRINIVLHAFEVKDAIDDERRGFEAGPESRRACRESSGERPDRHNVFHIFARDLIQRAVTPAAIISVKREPVLRLFVGVLDPRGGRVLRRGNARRAQVQAQQEIKQRKREQRGCFWPFCVHDSFLVSGLHF